MHIRYKCLDPKTKRVYISRHVIFYETTFLFKPSNEVTSAPNLELIEFSMVDEWTESKFHTTQSTNSSQLLDSTTEQLIDHTIQNDANQFLSYEEKVLQELVYLQFKLDMGACSTTCQC